MQAVSCHLKLKYNEPGATGCVCSLLSQWEKAISPLSRRMHPHAAACRKSSLLHVVFLYLVCENDCIMNRHTSRRIVNVSNALIDSFSEFLPFCRQLFYYSSYKAFTNTSPTC
ncbi:MAG TPA: hypothetical protein PKE07_01780 [Lacibacter sp.]|nr:hypothetical protein [Lacibacter sp.]